MDLELEKFKENISIHDVAELFRYARAPHKDGSNSLAYYDSGGNLISIFKNKNTGHELFSNVHSRDEAGDLIQFIQREKGYNLGEVRVFCRNWLNEPPPTKSVELKAVKKISEADILDSFKMKPVNNRSYLYYRGITDKTINSDTFKNQIGNYTKFNEKKQKHYHYTAFPIRSQNGVVGLELKNRYFKGTEEDSLKSIGISHSNFPASGKGEKFVICESFEDALSHFQLFNVPDDRKTVYLSSNGSPNLGQYELIEKLAAKFQPEFFVLANDNDVAGMRFNMNYMSMLGEPKGNVLGIEANLKTKHYLKYSIHLDKAIKDQEIEHYLNLFNEKNKSIPVEKWTNYEKPYKIDQVNDNKITVITHNRYERAKELERLTKHLLDTSKVKVHRPDADNKDWNQVLQLKKKAALEHKPQIKPYRTL